VQFHKILLRDWLPALNETEFPSLIVGGALTQVLL